MPSRNTIIDYVNIDAERINVVCECYFKWKDLNAKLSNISHRGINMPDAISEPMACYCLDFLWNRGNVPGDATDSEQNLKIEFKATSNYDYDLTSFGPDAFFDALYFLRFDTEDNILYIYDLETDSNQLKEWPANNTQTVGDQQRQRRRPHIRIIDTIIEPRELEPIIVFDIRRMEVIEDNR